MERSLSLLIFSTNSLEIVLSAQLCCMYVLRYTVLLVWLHDCFTLSVSPGDSLTRPLELSRDSERRTMSLLRG